MNNVDRLCAWYDKQCRDDWHEELGVEIGTIDNPGWSLRVDLARTALFDRHLDAVRIEVSEHDWIHALTRNGRFEAFGGPAKLDEMIGMFLAWAEEP